MILKNNHINHTSKEMSILVSMYGLSFMINNEAKQSFFEYPFKSANPIQLAKELPIILSERHIDVESFDKIQLIHHNQLNTLIPTALFEADKAKALVNLNVQTLDGDQCQSDLIPSLDAYNYYVVYHKIIEYFSSANLINHHSATKFFDAINKIQINRKTTPIFEVFINIYPKDFQLAIFKNDQLQAFNHFDYANTDEFLYYLFFMIETMEVNETKGQLYIMGKPSDNDMINNLKSFTDNYTVLPERVNSQINNFIL